MESTISRPTQAIQSLPLRELSLLALRLLIVFIFLWHGLPKAFDLPFATAKFVGYGLPGILGPITGWVEVVASLFVLVGFKHRWAMIVLAVVILGAIITVQLPGGFSAGLERDLMILAGTFVLIAQGPGMLAVDERLEAKSKD